MKPKQSLIWDLDRMLIDSIVNHWEARRVAMGAADFHFTQE